MRNFLLEVYTADDVAVGDAVRRLRHAARELDGSGTHVRYRRFLFLPDDETCFYVLEGDSAAAIAALSNHADVGPGRVVEAVDRLARAATSHAP